MIKALLTLVYLVSLLIPSTANSQGVLQLSKLEVDIWSEYDQPSVLVIYHITLPAETALPVELAFRLPAVAGGPNAVAVQQPNGQLFSIDYQSQIRGEWEWITFTATLPEIQVEYYDPRLQKEGGQKSYTFFWSGDYAVEDMLVQVQLPVGASEMQIKPGPVSRTTGMDGLTYYNKEIGSVAKDQSFSLEITYNKASDQLSISTLQVQPSAPLSPSGSWRDHLHNALPWLFTEDGAAYQILPWILGFLALVLIFGGGYWYWRTGQQEQKPRQRRAKTALPEVSGTADETGNVYCHRCGKRAVPGDIYCRSCGTRLRVE